VAPVRGKHGIGKVFISIHRYMRSSLAQREW